MPRPRLVIAAPTISIGRSSDNAIMQKVMELFQRLYSRRMLVRLVGVRFSSLVSGSYQIDLFNDTLTQINLCQAMDRIRMRFGSESVKRMSTLRNNEIDENGKVRIRA